MNTTTATHGTITVDRSALTTVTRHDNEPHITEISIDIDLPDGVSLDDIFFATAERDRVLAEAAPELSFVFADTMLLVKGEVKAPAWLYSSQKDPSELESLYAGIACALSEVAQPQANVTLTPKLLRGVKYVHERGSYNESALRDMYDYWRVHLAMTPSNLLVCDGADICVVKDDQSFGWRGPDWEVRFTWISQTQAVTDGLAAHALIRCQIIAEDDVLERVLLATENLEAHEAASKATEAFHAFFLKLSLPDQRITVKTVHIGGLLTPWAFFFAEVFDH